MPFRPDEPVRDRLKKRCDAQDKLMAAMQVAFCDEGLTLQEAKEMSNQFRRVERLFGYQPGSFSRGV